MNRPTSPAVRKADVEPLRPPGTRRTYQAFSRCMACGRVYWHRAHGRRLDDIVDPAIRTVAALRPQALSASQECSR